MSDPGRNLRALFLEDSEDDARLQALALERQGYALDWERVETEEGLLGALERAVPDVILADHAMPGINSARALELLRARRMEVPFVLVSGTIGEEAAVAAMRAGASDYVSKGNLDRLGPAVERARNELGLRREHQAAQEALAASEARFRALFEDSPDAIVITEGDRIVDCNARAPALFGLTREALVGRAIGTGEFSPPRQPDGSESAARLAALKEAALAGETQRFEWQIVRPDGTTATVDVVYGRLVHAHAVGLQVILRDISEQKAAEEALRRIEADYHALFEDVPDGMFLLRADGSYVDCNARVEEIFGWPRDWLIERTFADVSPELQPDGQPSRTKGHALLAAAAAGEVQQFEWQVLCADGSPAFLEVTLGPLARAGRATLFALGRDVTAQRRTETERHKLSRALQQSADAIMITDANEVLEYVNPAFERITGYGAAEVLGHTPAFLASGQDDPEVRARLRADIRAGREFHGVLVNRRRSGEHYYADTSIAPVRDEAGTLTHFIGSHYDITEKLRTEHQLAHLTHYDPLTDLPNRLLMLDRLERLLTQAQRFGWQLAVMQVDLDGFGLVNESWGQEGGDHVLRTVGQRLVETVGADVPVGRVGNDGFVVLAVLTDEGDRAERRASELQQALRAPIHYRDEFVTLTCSVGLALAPDDAAEAEALLGHAETALHRAKRQGREQIAFYAPGMGEEARKRLTVETGLRRALEQGEFRLEYQPQVELQTGRISGVEALLRWDDPDRGLVSPGEFIPLLEASGLIVPVGEWVLREACTEMGRWHEALAAGGRDTGAVRVAVNLSLVQFEQRDLVTVVRDVLAETGTEARLLELELTETSLARSPDEAARTLQGLRELGVTVALDDFGVGYSSLNYLKRFPIDVVKIDRVFVDEITRDPGDAAILRAVLELARSRGMKTVAEGVETEAQVRFLLAEGCRHVQGFHFSRPVGRDELGRLLGQDRPFPVNAAPRGR